MNLSPLRNRRSLYGIGLAAILALGVGACDSMPSLPGMGGESADKELKKSAGASARQPVVVDKDQIGTPMAERVATLGFLNKRNNLSRDINLKPGESLRIGNAIVRLSACERTAPWETDPEEGAFVQLFVNERRAGEDEAKWRTAFSGWLFRNSPSLNVVEHPIYDVWVKKCEMRFPGEEESAPKSGDDNTAAKPSGSERRAAPTPAPAASPSPADEPAEEAPPPAET